MKKKRGPKKKEMEAVQNIRISVYVNATERARLQELAGEMPLPGYLRIVGLGRQPPRPIPAVNMQIWQDLARVGANLNQISHNLNYGMDVHIDTLVKTIADVKKSLNAVRQALLT